MPRGASDLTYATDGAARHDRAALSSLDALERVVAPQVGYAANALPDGLEWLGV